MHQLLTMSSLRLGISHAAMQMQPLSPTHISVGGTYTPAALLLSQLVLQAEHAESSAEQYVKLLIGYPPTLDIMYEFIHSPEGLMAQSWPGIATFKQSEQERGREQMPPEYQVHESPLFEASVFGALVNTKALELPSDELGLVEFTLPTSFSQIGRAHV